MHTNYYRSSTTQIIISIRCKGRCRKCNIGAASMKSSFSPRCQSPWPYQQSLRPSRALQRRSGTARTPITSTVHMTITHLVSSSRSASRAMTPSTNKIKQGLVGHLLSWRASRSKVKYRITTVILPRLSQRKLRCKFDQNFWGAKPRRIRVEPYSVMFANQLQPLQLQQISSKFKDLKVTLTSP